MTPRPQAPLAGALLCLWAALGCAATPYTFGRNLEGPNTLLLREGEEQIERGRPNAFLDGVGSWVFGLPSKILLLDARVDNHDVSEETVETMHDYLAANDLHNVKVRVNQWAPGDEWRRLFANEAVNPLWRFTLGAFTVAMYTLLPQRLLGGDNYNPFTNTISLYSDVPAIALHEGGHAKDFAPYSPFAKGFYAALRLLPLVPLFQEADATADAIGYAKETGLLDTQKETYHVLYPAYGTYVGGEASRWISAPTGIAYAIQYGPVVPGHILGRIAGSRVPDVDPELAAIPGPRAPYDEPIPLPGTAPAEAGERDATPDVVPLGGEVDLDAVHHQDAAGVGAGADDQAVVR